MKRIYLFLAASVLCAGSMQLRAECAPAFVNLSLSSEADFTRMGTAGDADVWTYDAGYTCAVASSRGADADAWLITPSVDMDGASVIVFSFDHAHRFASVSQEEMTLWMTANYTGDPATSQWIQLPIPNYSDNSSWKFYSNQLAVPGMYAGHQTVFGFRYKSNNAKWEIRNIRIVSSCPSETERANRSLRICGQNLQNYYYNFAESSRPSYHDAAGLAQKTSKIVLSALRINADIYAFCEVEGKPIVLNQLADSLNKYCGVPGRYAAVYDGINRSSDQYDNALKSGFIYRTDRVAPVGSNTAASTYNYYEDVMRIQAFEEKASGGRFVLSMNHFKAKDSSSDAGESMRNTNAEHLISALKGVSIDPDILVMGDLNCTANESPVKKIIKAGYAEQILRFDAGAFSYCYDGGELIDHVLANSSMAGQVMMAYVLHVCTMGCGYENNFISYSDHDPYIVELCLKENGNCQYQDMEEVPEESNERYQCTKVLRDGQLYIIVGDKMYNVLGQIKN